ncbi:hypothetical protein H257_14671 [Aphanomyces astaci]|uniref:Secreted protein n=1 Tax=Aphanomyces astaci TaxID=112090 RepID=W4FSQ1_APHAT|nr:hypothetical protein H257_14671 [Aphanomyces astaci]ETV69648.1 hypothetical protein H257_14671 [Aphanomyces astaci]|eukprot:XP_009840864.1 hypothetical protein H257_14671 [Aphanomyces astaci]
MLPYKWCSLLNLLACTVVLEQESSGTLTATAHTLRSYSCKTSCTYSSAMLMTPTLLSAVMQSESLDSHRINVLQLAFDT